VPDRVERLYALPLLEDDAATLDRLPQHMRESVREERRWQHPKEEEKWLPAMVRGSTLGQLSAYILFALLEAALEMLIKMLKERIRARTVAPPIRPFAPRRALSSRVA
jgi:hypothetical protein